MAQIIQTSKICSNELEKQVSCECSENLFALNQKLIYDLILALIGIKKDPKIWPLRAHILHTSKNTSSELAKQVSYKSSGNRFQNI